MGQNQLIMTVTKIHQLLHENREEAFRQLYDSCFPAVLRLVRNTGGQQEDARDVFHDALIILYEKHLSGQLVLTTGPKPYVIGIVKHLWRRQSGKQGKELSFSAFEKQLDVPDRSQNEPLSRPHLRLFKFLSVAGRRCLDILQAFYYQQMPLAQIAEEFGFASTRSATVQKHKCLKKIQSAIQEKQLDNYETVVA